jgi:diacylglycerol kinase (ATP)
MDDPDCGLRLAGRRKAVTSPQRGKTGIARIVQATQVSFEGFVAAFRFEAAFRQELLLAALLIPLALILPVQPLGRALMIGSVLLLLITELLNSAVEAAVDRIVPLYST